MIEPRRYICRRVPTPLRIDGFFRDPGWNALPWSEDFVDITGDEDRPPRLRTRVKMGWDNSSFYVRAELEDSHVWGTIREKNAALYEENNFELFLDPDGDGRNYYELEINPLGTIWELTLPRPYREGGVAESGTNLTGLRNAVFVRGTVNDPGDLDDGWSVELGFPWSALARYNGDRATPPEPGDIWRVNFSRVQWKHEIVDGRYVRVPPHGTPRPTGLHSDEYEHPEDNWVWSPQGVVNMHIPSRWGEVVFE